MVRPHKNGFKIAGIPRWTTFKKPMQGSTQTSTSPDTLSANGERFANLTKKHGGKPALTTGKPRVRQSHTSKDRKLTRSPDNQHSSRYSYSSEHTSPHPLKLQVISRNLLPSGLPKWSYEHSAAENSKMFSRIRNLTPENLVESKSERKSKYGYPSRSKYTAKKDSWYTQHLLPSKQSNLFNKRKSHAKHKKTSRPNQKPSRPSESRKYSPSPPSKIASPFSAVEIHEQNRGPSYFVTTARIKPRSRGRHRSTRLQRPSWMSAAASRSRSRKRRISPYSSKITRNYHRRRTTSPFNRSSRRSSTYSKAWGGRRSGYHSHNVAYGKHSKRRSSFVQQTPISAYASKRITRKSSPSNGQSHPSRMASKVAKTSQSHSSKHTRKSGSDSIFNTSVFCSASSYARSELCLTQQSRKNKPSSAKTSAEGISEMSSSVNERELTQRSPESKPSTARIGTAGSKILADGARNVAEGTLTAYEEAQSVDEESRTMNEGIRTMAEGNQTAYEEAQAVDGESRTMNEGLQTMAEGTQSMSSSLSPDNTASGKNVGSPRPGSSPRYTPWYVSSTENAVEDTGRDTTAGVVNGLSSEDKGKAKEDVKEKAKDESKEGAEEAAKGELNILAKKKTEEEAMMMSKGESNEMGNLILRSAEEAAHQRIESKWEAKKKHELATEESRSAMKYADGPRTKAKGSAAQGGQGLENSEASVPYNFRRRYWSAAKQ